MFFLDYLQLSLTLSNHPPLLLNYRLYLLLFRHNFLLKRPYLGILLLAPGKNDHPVALLLGFLRAWLRDFDFGRYARIFRLLGGRFWLGLHLFVLRFDGGLLLVVAA